MSRNTVMTVDRRPNITLEEFAKEYRDPGIPVVLTGLSKEWRAYETFSFDFFQKEFGHREIKIPYPNTDRYYTLYEFIECLRNSTRENPAPYPCVLNVSREFSDLLPYLKSQPAITKPNRTINPLLPGTFVPDMEGISYLEVFMGGPGGEFPILHYDCLGVHTLSTLMCGRKEFTLYTPEQNQYLYPKKTSQMVSEIEDHHHPDFEKYPLFAQAVPTIVTLEPGETLFIPSGWYHTARSLNLTISVSFDLLCESNWKFFVQECCRGRHPLKAVLMHGYLTSLGACLSALESLLLAR